MSPAVVKRKRARPEGLDGLFQFGVKNRALHSNRYATLVQALSHWHDVRCRVSLNSPSTTSRAISLVTVFKISFHVIAPMPGMCIGTKFQRRETIISGAGREAGTDIRAILGAINPQTDSESSSSPFRLGRHTAVGCHNRGKSNLVFPGKNLSTLPTFSSGDQITNSKSSSLAHTQSRF